MSRTRLDRVRRHLSFAAMALLVGASAPGDSPQLMAPGVISTADFEFALALSPDGKTAYFTKGDPGYNRLTIVESSFANGRWSRPRVAPFSGIWKDTDASVSPDGRTLYFISNRPTDGGTEPRNDYDIWYAERLAGGGWGAAKHLPGPVNTDGNEAYPSVTRDGTLYFESNRLAHPGIHIYSARPAGAGFGEPQLLDFAGSGNDINPAVAEDGSFLIFANRDRPGSLGQNDLFYSTRLSEGHWSAPERLGPRINSKFNDTAPALSRDGRTLYFSSNRIDEPIVRTKRADHRQLERELRGPQNGLLDIYQVPLGELNGAANGG